MHAHPSIEIPNKSTFKLDEVCGLTGVKPYILRFWEAEFPQISSIETSNGQKLYEQKDIEAVLVIKKLLFDDKLTIEKAKVEIMKMPPVVASQSRVHQLAQVSAVSVGVAVHPNQMLELKKKVENLIGMLDFYQSKIKAINN